jgi:hypothetical protein
MKLMKVLARGTAALTVGGLLLSETAFADGYRSSHKAALHARGWGWRPGGGWWLADAGALNTNPYSYFPTYGSPYGYVAYAYGPYGYGYGYGYPRRIPSLGNR